MKKRYTHGMSFNDKEVKLLADILSKLLQGRDTTVLGRSKLLPSVVLHKRINGFEDEIQIELVAIRKKINQLMNEIARLDECIANRSVESHDHDNRYLPMTDMDRFFETRLKVVRIDGLAQESFTDMLKERVDDFMADMNRTMIGINEQIGTIMKHMHEPDRDTIKEIVRNELKESNRGEDMARKLVNGNGKESDVRQIFDEERIEVIAEQMHKVWCNWAAHVTHCFDNCSYNEFAKLRTHWRERANTKYSDLPDVEKDACKSDAEQILFYIGQRLPYTEEELQKIDKVIQRLLDK